MGCPGWYRLVEAVEGCLPQPTPCPLVPQVGLKKMVALFLSYYDCLYFLLPEIMNMMGKCVARSSVRVIDAGINSLNTLLIDSGRSGPASQPTGPRLCCAVCMMSAAALATKLLVPDLHGLPVRISFCRAYRRGGGGTRFLGCGPCTTRGKF